MKFLPLLAALVFSAALNAQHAAGSHDQPGRPVKDVDFCELAKTPADFAGKTIRIRGIYRYVLEQNDFEPTECCPHKMSYRFHASISGNPMYPNSHSERLARKLTVQMSATALVVFIGTFNGQVLEVDRVERIERLAHPKDSDHQPTWVPQNCGQDHVPGE